MGRRITAHAAACLQATAVLAPLAPPLYLSSLSRFSYLSNLLYLLHTSAPAPRYSRDLSTFATKAKELRALRCMLLLFRPLVSVISPSKLSCFAAPYSRMSSSSSCSQIICNVTPAAVASFPPALTICISTARDVSAAKLNDVRFQSIQACARVCVTLVTPDWQIIRRDGIALSRCQCSSNLCLF